MKSRLTNYFQAAKLAKLHITEALGSNARRDTPNAVRHLAEAELSLLVCMNNIASIAFNSKPKGK